MYAIGKFFLKCPTWETLRSAHQLPLYFYSILFIYVYLYMYREAHANTVGWKYLFWNSLCTPAFCRGLTSCYSTFHATFSIIACIGIKKVGVLIDLAVFDSIQFGACWPHHPNNLRPVVLQYNLRMRWLSHWYKEELCSKVLLVSGTANFAACHRLLVRTTFCTHFLAVRFYVLL